MSVPTDLSASIVRDCVGVLWNREMFSLNMQQLHNFKNFIHSLGSILVSSKIFLVLKLWK
jgi:hypothetical protein